MLILLNAKYMSSSFCLTASKAEKIKKKIISGEIDISKLSEASSAERRKFFQGILGEERLAKETNALFESKLLLKNQKRGLVNWAKQITGIKPQVRRDLISRIERMEKILSPEDEAKFLEDLASKRLGADITTEEASKILELSNKIKELENYTNDKERIAYGRAKIELGNYVNELAGKKPNWLINIAGVPRSLMASLDLSAPLNQGWGMLSRKQFYSSLRDMFKYAKSDANLLDLQADIITRPTYKQAKKAGLRLTDLGQNLEKREEAFLTTLLDKVPGIKASQRAYTGFLNKLRMDVFDDLIKKAEIAGEDVGVGSKALEDIANMVNNFTGGAKLPGGLNMAQKETAQVFFSPRKIASTLNMLNPKNYLNPKISKTARKEAFRNLIGSLSISASVIGLARMLGSDKPETDPRSSDFGKIKVGNTTLDVSGGNANYITLLSRLLTQKTKSTKTGELVDLGSGFGETSGFDLTANFLRYKLSPNASLLVDAIARSNALGEEKTIPQSVVDRLKPMYIESLAELLKSDDDGKFLLSLVALFGAGLSTYDRTPKEKETQKKSVPLRQ